MAEINSNPNCPNKHCEGGVITRDGVTGKLCKKCNPTVKELLPKLKGMMWDTNQYVPFEPNRAAEISLDKGFITIQRRLTVDQIIEEFGQYLTKEQIAKLKKQSYGNKCNRL